MSVPSARSDAILAARLMAVDPPGTGAVLCGLPGPERDHWITVLGQLLPPPAAIRRIPIHVGDDRLIGGIDLAATLRAGRPIAERGLLAQCDGGVALLATAERQSRATVGHIVAAIDSGSVAVERDGIAERHPARFGVVALDESDGEDERPALALLDRLAFRIDLRAIGDQPVDETSTASIAAARIALSSVVVDAAVVGGLCRGATAFGIDSVRAALMAVRVARLHAALRGRRSVSEPDAAAAARLVLAPRATTVPAMPPDREVPDTASSTSDRSSPGDDFDHDTGGDIGEIVVSAARAAVPADLLRSLARAAAPLRRSSGDGRTGMPKQNGRRGRPIGVRRGDPREGGRLHVLETLRAAAPRQRLRRTERIPTEASARRVEVRREDFRLVRFEQPSETTTIFAVDASGSAALHRLAEAKGAIELLLADCYVRRDRVALIAFRRSGAETILAPTRSLTRAKRSLEALPGGGGTPLAAGIEAAARLAGMERRQGRTPVVVLLTDGQANVALDGCADRPRAEADAIAAGRRLGATCIDAILIDAAPRPRPATRTLASMMGARYVPLPHADARVLSAAVRAVA